MRPGRAEVSRRAGPVRRLSRGRELYGLQMLRAVAALLVVFHHALECSLLARVGPRSPDWLTTFGAAGVDIFFVISGFVMVYTSFGPGRPPPSAGDFLRRRIIRIYPLYWVCLAAAVVLGVAGLLHQASLSTFDVVAAIMLLPHAPLVIGLTWTLRFEMLFYLVFAAALRVPTPRGTVAATVIGLAVVMFAGALAPDGWASWFFRDPIVGEFVFGLALGYVTLRSREGVVAPILAVIAMALIVIAPVVVAHPSTGGLVGWPRVAAWGIPAALVVAACVGLERPKGWAGQLLVTLGDASYAIYLVHYFAIGVYARLLRTTVLGDVPQVMVIPVFIALCALLGIAVDRLIDRPLRGMIMRPTASPARRTARRSPG